MKRCGICGYLITTNRVVCSCEVEKLTLKNTELKSQLASNHSYAQHVADDLGWYDRSELRKSMLDNLYKIIGDYPHPYIERLEKQLEGT